MVAVLSEDPAGSAAILFEASEMRGVIWPTMFCTLKMVAFAGVSVARGLSVSKHYTRGKEES